MYVQFSYFVEIRLFTIINTFSCSSNLIVSDTLKKHKIKNMNTFKYFIAHTKQRLVKNSMPYTEIQGVVFNNDNDCACDCRKHF